MFGLDTALILSKTAAMSVNFGTVENVRLAERKKNTSALEQQLLQVITAPAPLKNIGSADSAAHGYYHTSTGIQHYFSSTPTWP